MFKKPKSILCKRFKSWSDILHYDDIIKPEFANRHVQYSLDIYFDEWLNDYKVIVKVY